MIPSLQRVRCVLKNLTGDHASLMRQARELGITRCDVGGVIDSGYAVPMSEHNVYARWCLVVHILRNLLEELPSS